MVALIMSCQIPLTGIELDPNSKILWSALTACKNAYEADKKIRFKTAEKERELEESRLRHREQLKKQVQADKEKLEKADMGDDLLAGFFGSVEASAASAASKTAGSSSSGAGGSAGGADVQPTAGDVADGQNDDALADFFNEVTASAEAAKQIRPARPAATQTAEERGGDEEDEEPTTTEKYTKQDLGTGQEQYARLMGSHYEWRNLNPYYVFQLDTDATEEDIKFRYKKLSLKVHPDRLRDVEHAREAFEQVRSKLLGGNLVCILRQDMYGGDGSSGCIEYRIYTI